MIDKYKHKVGSKKRQLLNLKDKLNEVSDVMFQGSDEVPEMRRVRELENNLDKVMIKYNEAQSIRKTYEQVKKPTYPELPSKDRQEAQGGACDLRQVAGSD